MGRKVMRRAPTRCTSRCQVLQGVLGANADAPKSTPPTPAATPCRHRRRPCHRRRAPTTLSPKPTCGPDAKRKANAGAGDIPRGQALSGRRCQRAGGPPLRRGGCIELARLPHRVRRRSRPSGGRLRERSRVLLEARPKSPRRSRGPLRGQRGCVVPGAAPRAPTWELQGRRNRSHMRALRSAMPERMPLRRGCRLRPFFLRRRTAARGLGRVDMEGHPPV